MTNQVETEQSDQVRLTADVVLFGEFDGVAHVLLIERAYEPFQCCWALPGGHVDAGESAEDAAHRELAEETGLRVGALTHVGAYSAPGRDPRGRYVTFAYTGRMPHRIEPTAGDDAALARWMPLETVLAAQFTIAFDHAQIIRDARNAARPYTA